MGIVYDKYLSISFFFVRNDNMRFYTHRRTKLYRSQESIKLIVQKKKKMTLVA